MNIQIRWFVRLASTLHAKLVWLQEHAIFTMDKSIRNPYMYALHVYYYVVYLVELASSCVHGVEYDWQPLGCLMSADNNTSTLSAQSVSVSVLNL